MNRTIFIFDDDMDILDLCKIILMQKGYQVHTSNDCNEVTERVVQAAPDLVLMDNKIPDRGGIWAVQQLKLNPATQHIPVIFFSANTNVEQLSREAGADQFMRKPFDIRELETSVETAIRESLLKR